jgi:hypothetical protein
MASKYCCDCGDKLAKPTAKFCSNGHSQSEGSTSKESTSTLDLGGKDRHADDDEVELISKDKYTSSLRRILPLQDVQDARSKAVQRDSISKARDKQHGTYGIRPANSNSIKKSVVIWLCERPPIRPRSVGVPLFIKLNLPIDWSSSELVDSWIRHLVSTFPLFQDHQNIVFSELVVDHSRAAYIGRMEGKHCAWWAIWDELQSNDDIALFLQGKDTLQLCIPVQRQQQEEDAIPSKVTAAKRPRAISKTYNNKRLRNTS